VGVAVAVAGLAASAGYIRHRVWISPNLGYMSFIGATLWIASLVACATGAETIAYARKMSPDFKFASLSYVNFLVAANVLLFICFSLFICLDLKKSVGAVTRNFTMVAEVIMVIFALIAAAVASKNFDNICHLQFSSLNQCTTYQSYIFFTYVVFLGLLFKMAISFCMRNQVPTPTITATKVRREKIPDMEMEIEVSVPETTPETEKGVIAV